VRNLVLDLSSNLSAAEIERIRAVFGDRLHLRGAR